MNHKFRFHLVILMLAVVVNSCQKIDRDNPWDEKASPESWAPKNLTITMNYSSSITLDWEQEIAVEGFKIERKTENQSWQTLSANVSGMQRQYTDKNIEFSNEYLYRISAFVKNIFSAYVEAYASNNVTNPSTGKTWMDRNLGVSRAATSSTDDQAYGDLYQWGRGKDGHEKRISGITSNLSSSDTPGHGNFISVGSNPYDWRSPKNNNLWQGVNDINNPCPPGYRVPTASEWDAERRSWSSNNATGAYASPLKLPVAGLRIYSYGWLSNVGSGGYYWSATVDGTYARNLYLNSYTAGMGSYYRSGGYSVRCIKD